jgi:branched-subunit amino acid transport protein
MSLWIAVVVAGLGSYVLRALPFLAGDRVHLSDRAQAGLRHAGIGAITSLLVLGVVAVLRPGSGLPVVPVVVTLVAAMVCALLGRTMLTTVVIGAASYGVALVLMSPGLLGR